MNPAPQLFQHPTVAGEVAVPALHVGAPPRAQLRVCVIIPAKDEAQRITATLAALVTQTDLAGNELDFSSYEILLLANNCQDATAAVARRFARQHPQLVLHVLEIQLPPAEAHIGRARRLLMDEACRRLERVGNAPAFIASTDGDTCVTPTWLAAIEAELATGAVAVGGRILTRTLAGATSAVRRLHLRDATYRLLRARLEHYLDPSAIDPWPRHHQHFGANMAISVRAYRQVGGLPVVPFLEDEALFASLRRHDLAVRHSPAVRVYTSDRQQGRVAIGLSWQLREWAALSRQQREPLVEGVGQLVAEWRGRQQLRQLWRAFAAGQSAEEPEDLVGLMLRKEQLAASLGLAAGALTSRLRQGGTFGALWEWVQQQQRANTRWARRWALVPLSQALTELRQQLRSCGASLREQQPAGSILTVSQISRGGTSPGGDRVCAVESQPPLCEA